MFGIGDFFIGVLPYLLEAFKELATFLGSPVPTWVLQFTTFPLYLLAELYDLFTLINVGILGIFQSTLDFLPSSITPDFIEQLASVLESVTTMLSDIHAEQYFNIIYEAMVTYAQTFPLMVYLFILAFGLIVVFAVFTFALFVLESILDIIFNAYQAVMSFLNLAVPG